MTYRVDIIKISVFVQYVVHYLSDLDRKGQSFEYIDRLKLMADNIKVHA